MLFLLFIFGSAFCVVYLFAYLIDLWDMVSAWVLTHLANQDPAIFFVPLGNEKFSKSFQVDK